MRLPRFVHQAFAALAGYFWLPCPICGEPFGGHEATGDAAPIPGRPGVERLICPRCAKTRPVYTLTTRPAERVGQATTEEDDR